MRDDEFKKLLKKLLEKLTASVDKIAQAICKENGVEDKQEQQ